MSPHDLSWKRIPNVSTIIFERATTIIYYDSKLNLGIKSNALSFELRSLISSEIVVFDAVLGSIVVLSYLDILQINVNIL